MKTEDLINIEVGDRIRFRAATRWSDRLVWRQVNGFDHGRPTVRFGWPQFIVRLHEITEVEKANA